MGKLKLEEIGKRKSDFKMILDFQKTFDLVVKQNSIIKSNDIKKY